jgi:hypothetical protein
MKHLTTFALCLALAITATGQTFDGRTATWPGQYAILELDRPTVYYGMSYTFDHFSDRCRLRYADVDTTIVLPQPFKIGAWSFLGQYLGADTVNQKPPFLIVRRIGQGHRIVMY